MDISSMCETLIQHGKSAVSPSDSDSRMKSYRLSALGLISLKKLNRMKLMELDAKKKEVEGHRERAGKAQLRLENLLYKEAHLLREIQICKEFSCNELSAVESELECSIAVDSYSQDLSALHKNSLQKLKAELQERKDARDTLKQRQEERSQLVDALQKKRKLLEEFPERVKVLKEAASGLSEFIGSEDTGALDGSIELSRNLPTPLYVLFRSAFSMTTIGSQSSVSAVNITPLREDTGVQVSVDGAWAVDITVTTCISDSSDTNNAASCTLRFTHSERNGLVGVTVLTLDIKDGNKSVPLPFTCLSACLFPSGMGVGQAIHEESRDGDDGIPYVWAQWICGLRRVPDIAPDIESPNTMSLDQICSLVCSRLRSIWTVTRIISSVKPPTTVTDPSAPIVPLPAPLLAYYEALTGSFQSLVGVKASLKNLVVSDPPSDDPFQSYPICEEGSDASIDESANRSGVVGLARRQGVNNRSSDKRQQNVYMKASIQLEGVQDSIPSTAVNVLIEISPEYPLVPPQVLLSSRKQTGTAVNATLRQLEQEINAGCVNFMDILGDPDLTPALSSALSSAMKNSESLEQAMNGILALQLSLMLRMLSQVYATHHSEIKWRQINGNNTVKSKFSNFYGRKFCV